MNNRSKNKEIINFKQLNIRSKINEYKIALGFSLDYWWNDIWLELLLLLCRNNIFPLYNKLLYQFKKNIFNQLYNNHHNNFLFVSIWNEVHIRLTNCWNFQINLFHRIITRNSNSKILFSICIFILPKNNSIDTLSI